MSRALNILLLVSFLGSGQSFAQITPKIIDSLNKAARAITSFDSSNVSLKEIIAKANAINYPKGAVDAAIGMAMNVHNHGKFEESIRITNNWERATLATKDNERIAHLYALMGNSYCRLSFFEKSLECLAKATPYAEKITDSNQRNYSLGRINGIRALIFKEQKSVPHHLDSSLYYRTISYQMQQKITEKGVIKTNLIVQANAIGRLYLLKSNLDSARYYYRTALAITKENKLERPLGDSYLGLGDTYQIEKNLDSALSYYHKALNISLRTKYLSVIKDCYQKMALVYEQKGNREKSFYFLKRHAHLADSLAQANKNAVKVSSDFILNERESGFKRTSAYYLMLIASSVMLLIAIIYLLFLLRKRFKKTVALHKEKQDFLYEKLAILKDTTLTDKVDDEAIKHVIELAAANDPSFLIKFQEIHPVFIQKLVERAPNLVTTDLLICAQLRLGFYTKEIARYTKISVRAVEGKKYRIRKKLSIPATDDINVWMMQV